jgi:hypothetical protein
LVVRQLAFGVPFLIGLQKKLGLYFVFYFNLENF